LFNCVVLYPAAGLILPGRRNSDSASLLADFEKHGHLALGTLTLMLLLASPFAFYYTLLAVPDEVSTADVLIWSFFLPSNIINYALIASIGVVLLRRKYSWQVAGTIIFAFLEIWGLMAFWSTPGR
jgi:hypothetical protein